MNILNKILRRSVTFHKRNLCKETEQYQRERKLLRELCSKIRFRKEEKYLAVPYQITEIPNIQN